MIYYQQEEDNSKGKMIGGAATLLYVIILTLLFLLVKFNVEVQSEGEGILINFGNVDEAAPGADMAMNDQIADAPQVERRTQAARAEQEQLTQDFEEAPAAKETKKPVKKPQDQAKETPKPTPKPTPPAEKPREVNRRALFPGRTEGSTATSDGTGQGAGNQGNLAGSPSGSYDGTGTGNSGGSASLSGRSLLGSLPRPDYGAKEEGRVVVNITVDQSGKVTAASYRSVGSTTQNSALVNAAIKAARQARFNLDDNAPLSQTGTITYNFRMQ